MKPATQLRHVGLFSAEAGFDLACLPPKLKTEDLD